MTTTGALSVATTSPVGDAPAAPLQPGAVPGAAAMPAGDEVLSAIELLRLLEQNTGFAQALAGAAADGSIDTTPSAPATPAGTAAKAPAAPAPRSVQGPLGDDAAPCDIVTLLRLLESPPQPAAAAAVTTSTATAPAGARRRVSEPADAAAGAATDGATADTATAAAAVVALVLANVVPAAVVAAAEDAGSGDTDIGARPQAAGQESGIDVTAATRAGIASADNAVHRGGPAGIDALIAAADAAAAPTSADAPVVDAPGRDASTARAPDAPQAPVDPARVTLAMAQTFRTETPASAPVERTIHVPVRDPAWPQAVAAEIHFLADRQVEAATLRLSPEHLGPVEVRIDVRDNNVSVTFGVAHGDTQAALEQALPRLREMFAAAGLNLGQASVQQEARRSSHNGGAAPAAGEAAGEAGDGAWTGTVGGVGLVDEYA